MKRGRFTEAKIIAVQREAESGRNRSCLVNSVAFMWVLDRARFARLPGADSNYG
jgi:hypothetical protein